jgi:hypothetical protein
VRSPLRSWGPAAAIAALALLASFNGLWNGFTYDDRHIVLGNLHVKDLSRAWTLFVLPYWPIHLGGDGYRPMTLAFFSIQWALGGGSAFLFHAVGIVAYALTCVMGFRVARLMLPVGAAWLAAAFFAVHPVHVESVANIVGQAEIWVALCLLTATWLYVDGRRRAPLSSVRQSAIGLLYLAACLFKEHAIVLPALIVVGEVLLVQREARLRIRLAEEWKLFAFMLLGACLYVYFRTAVIGRDLAGFSVYPPFLTLDVGPWHRALTMLGVIPHWIRLLFWPARLSAEYGPPAYPIATTTALWQIPGLVILAGVTLLAIALRKRNPAFGFGVAWLGLTLLPSSNLLLPTGILLAERTLFSPSFGAMIALGATLPLLTPHLRSSATRIAVLVGGGAIILAGTARSIVQSAVWRDNESLFVASVAAEPRVYRGYYMLAAMLMEHRQLANGEKAYMKAIQLFPHDPFVFYNLGQEYFRAGLYDRAYEMYLRAYELMPDFQDVRTRLAFALAAKGDFAGARERAREALRAGSDQIQSLHTILAAADVDERARKRLQQDAARSPVKVLAR